MFIYVYINVYVHVYVYIYIYIYELVNWYVYIIVSMPPRRKRFIQAQTQILCDDVCTSLHLSSLEIVSFCFCFASFFFKHFNLLKWLQLADGGQVRQARSYEWQHPTKSYHCPVLSSAPCSVPCLVTVHPKWPRHDLQQQHGIGAICNMKFAATCTLRASEACLYIHAHMYDVWRVLWLLPPTWLNRPIEMTSAENMIHLWDIFADVFPYVRSVINSCCFVERDRHVKYGALSVLATAYLFTYGCLQGNGWVDFVKRAICCGVAVCCSVLRYVAAYCSILQCAGLSGVVWKHICACRMWLVRGCCDCSMWGVVRVSLVKRPWRVRFWRMEGRVVLKKRTRSYEKSNCKLSGIQIEQDWICVCVLCFEVQYHDRVCLQCTVYVPIRQTLS